MDGLAGANVAASAAGTMRGRSSLRRLRCGDDERALLAVVRSGFGGELGRHGGGDGERALLVAPWRREVSWVGIWAGAMAGTSMGCS